MTGISWLPSLMQECTNMSCPKLITHHCAHILSSLSLLTPSSEDELGIPFLPTNDNMPEKHLLKSQPQTLASTTTGINYSSVLYQYISSIASIVPQSTYFWNSNTK